MTERMTLAQYRSHVAKAGKHEKGGKNKYSARRTVVDGKSFDSAHEAKRYSELKVMERAGHISNLELQVPIFLEGREGPMLTETGRPMRLTVDFRYLDESTGLTVWEDAKGKKTRDYLVRKSAAEAQGFKIIEV